MNILVMSDTHGNLSMIEKMLGVAKENDLVIHLGDNYDDAYLFIQEHIPTIRVPGTWGAEYQNVMIENRRFETFSDIKFFLTHTPTKDVHDLSTDIDPHQVLINQDCDIFCHGHTHHPNIQKMGSVVILNPGHLKADYDRGFPASFAQIKIDSNGVELLLIEESSRSIIDAHRLK